VDAPEKILAFIGDILPRKNQKYLVSVLSYLPPNYRLLLIGHNVDHQYRRQIDAAMTPELRHRVTFTGNLPHERVPEHLARTHLWVSASLMEVQSLAVLEALASGTPVLGLSNETIDEMVDETAGGKLPRDTSPESFALAVRRLCEQDPASYAALCDGARIKARPFDWSNAMRTTELLYARAPQPVGSVRRGTFAIPFLLATAQMLLSMVFYLIVKITAFLDSFHAQPRRARRGGA
jgi:glycosyltransferase involved in cell wall biosynthesis